MANSVYTIRFEQSTPLMICPQVSSGVYRNKRAWILRTPTDESFSPPRSEIHNTQTNLCNYEKCRLCGKLRVPSNLCFSASHGCLLIIRRADTSLFCEDISGARRNTMSLPASNLYLMSDSVDSNFINKTLRAYLKTCRRGCSSWGGNARVCLRPRDINVHYRE